MANGGISALRRAQIALEGTKFAAEPATYRLVGVEPDLVPAFEYEMLGGFLGGMARATTWYMTGRAGTGSLKGPLFRDVEGLTPFVFSMQGYTRTGVAAPYSYAFANEFEPADIDTPTMTMEFGDNKEFLVGVGGVVTGWTLTGAVNKAVQVDTDISFADVLDTLTGFTDITPGTPDYSVASRRPPIILTNNMLLLVDGVSVGRALIGFTFAFNTGVKNDPRVDGTLAQNSQAYGIPEIEATITLETGTEEAASVSSMLAETAHLYSLQNALVSPTFKVSFTGAIAEMGTIGDSNGVSSIPFTIRDVYRPDLQANPLEVTMVTSNASYA